jgi:hypothetical protein
MKTHLLPLLVALSLGSLASGSLACGDKAADGAGSSSPSGSAKAQGSGSAKAAAPAGSGASSAAASGSAAAAPASDLAVLGGPDWKAVFVGAPPMTLQSSSGGGQGTGMADDYTTKTAYADPPWKYGAAGGGGVFRAPSKKAFAVSNINLKLDATPKAVDTWIKSALVKDVKHVGEPVVLEIGPDKAVGKTGAGTCKLQGGEDADFYWWDIYSTGDFAHRLMIVIVAKDAPEEDKKVALSILRQVSYTPKAKPHYKK